MKCVLLAILVLVGLFACTESFYYGRGFGYGYGRGFGYGSGWGYNRGWGAARYNPFWIGRRDYSQIGRRWLSYYPAYYPAYYPSYYSYGYGRDIAKPDSFDINAMHCHFFSNESVVSCRGPESIIECPVSYNMSRIAPLNFEFYGISRVQSLNYSVVEPENQYYYMVPRNKEDSRWLSYNVSVSGRVEPIKFYYSQIDSCAGIRVVDKACFVDLTKSFSLISHKLVVPIESVSKLQFELFGDVFVA